VAVDALADVGVTCPRAYSSRAVSSLIPGGPPGPGRGAVFSWCWPPAQRAAVVPS
ncbi:unnamed protein product, partial [Pylaiella littoralis]